MANPEKGCFKDQWFFKQTNFIRKMEGNLLISRRAPSCDKYPKKKMIIIP